MSMGGEAGQDLGSAQWAKSDMRKLTFRERLSRWIAPRPQINMEQVAAAERYMREVKEQQESQDLSGVPAFTFSVVTADNGKIIKYRAPVQETVNSIRGAAMHERSLSYGLYIVPEGAKLLEAIAAIIAKHRLQ